MDGVLVKLREDGRVWSWFILLGIRTSGWLLHG